MFDVIINLISAPPLFACFLRHWYVFIDSKNDTYACVCVHACVCTCMHEYCVRMCMHEYCVRMCMHEYCVRVCARIMTHACTYMYMYIDPHISIHIAGIPAMPAKPVGESPAPGVVTLQLETPHSGIGESDSPFAFVVRIQLLTNGRAKDNIQDGYLSEWNSGTWYQVCVNVYVTSHNFSISPLSPFLQCSDYQRH